MLDKLAAIEEKFEQINAQLFDPAVVSDIDKYRKLMQEAKHLTPIVEKYREYKKAQADYDYYKSLTLEAKENMVKAQSEYASRVDYDRSVILQSVNSETERLKQEASLAQQLYAQMKQQEEMAKAKIQEMKPVFAIVQPATQPLYPANSRKKLALGWAFFGFLLSAGWKVYLKEEFTNFKKRIQLYEN